MNKPLPLLLVTGLAFGCNFPFAKMAVAAGVNPALWAIVICLGAGLAVLAAATVFETAPAVPGVLRYAAISGFISNVIPLFLTFAAIPHIGSGLAAVLVATSPVTTALLSMLLKVRPPSLLGLAGIGVGLTGALVIIAGRNTSGFAAEEGYWLYLAALIPVFLGIGNVYRSLGWPKAAGPMRLGAMINLAAVPPLAVLALVRGGLDVGPLLTVPGLVAAQLAASTVMYLTFFRLQAAGGPTYLSQIGYVAAALSVAIGVSLLGETYPPVVWAGVAVVALGIGLSTLAQVRARPAS